MMDEAEAEEAEKDFAGMSVGMDQIAPKAVPQQPV